MPKRIGLRVGLFTLILLGWTAATWAVPLSIDSNIQAILAKQGEAASGFDFVVLGDSRDGAETFARLLNQVKALKPLFVIHTGDFVKKGDPVEYEDYIKQIASFDIPILHIPGNHDIRNGGEETYRRYVGESNWTFDLGRYRFVGLDNAAGKFSPEAVAFARKALTPEKTCLVAFHYPPAVGRWAVHSMVDDQQGGRGGEVMNLIKGAEVPLVFLGHIHLYDEMELDGARYVITAGGGAKLYEKYGFGKAEYGFLLVQVRPEGVTHRWVPLK